MDNLYPSEIQGDPVFENIFDVGFTSAVLNMSALYDSLKLKYTNPNDLLVELDSFFAVANVKAEGGSVDDMIGVANLHGSDHLGETLEGLRD